MKKQKQLQRLLNQVQHMFGLTATKYPDEDIGQILINNFKHNIWWSKKKVNTKCAQIVTLLAFCLHASNCLYMRDLEQKSGREGAGFVCEKNGKFYTLSAYSFFHKKTFDAVDKILNILDVERGG